MSDKADRVIAKIGRLAKAKASSALSAMLDEDAAQYRLLSTADAEWVRGHVFAALGKIGDFDASLAIEEELRTSYSPVVLAGVARAVAGSVGRADTAWRDLLITARDRIARRDEYVRFEGDICCPPERKASEHLEDAIAALSRTAPCCSVNGRSVESPASVELCAEQLSEIRMQDQNGLAHNLKELFAKRPSLIAFFYTRCMNPEKCSLTITRLAAQSRTADLLPDLNVFGLTYDPAFDTSERLRGYGDDLGFAFGEKAKLLRASKGQARLLSLLAPKVGFGPVTVNAHARELFLIDPELRMRRIPPDWIETPERLACELALIDARIFAPFALARNPCYGARHHDDTP
jgi:cytochrome oxidase Cu insertion factor (SCO1/SenC/PrrC family)